MMQGSTVMHSELNKSCGFYFKNLRCKEQEWELIDDDYRSILPNSLRWQNWAEDKKDGKAMTGDELLSFVNNTLFPTLKKPHYFARHTHEPADYSFCFLKITTTT